MSTTINLLIVAFLLLMNAFFVIAEFSLVRVRKSKLQMSLNEGKSGAKSALKVADNVNDYLSACQLGITIASLALGWIGEPAISHLIYPVTSFLGMADKTASVVSVALGFIIITTLHIVAGELIPKSLAIVSTEKFARLTAFVLICFYYVTFPVMWLFNTITNISMKLMGYDIKGEEEVYTSDEIMILMDESTENGLIDPEQNRRIDSLFELETKEVSSIMTPRKMIQFIDLELSSDENMEIIRNSKYTRYPVCNGSKDNLVGFVHIKDIFYNYNESTINNIELRPLIAVSESLSIDRLMKIMKEKECKIAAVVDEYGGTAGIVTVSDIMEKIMGKMGDEYIKSSRNHIISHDDSSVTVQGYMPVDELIEIIGFTPEGSDDFKTVSGIFFDNLGRVPCPGDIVSLHNNDHSFTLEIVKMDGNTVEEIRINKC